MTEPVDVYWSFRSPYSYLVTPDLLRLRDDYGVDVRMRIVYPIAIRDPSLVFDPANRNKSRYIVLDSRRRADYLGMPFVLPARPDPIVQDPATMAVAAEQPYIHRLSALGVEAQRRWSPRSRRSFSAAPKAGIRGIISATPWHAPAWTSPNWMLPSRAATSWRRWKAINRHSPRQVTGGCRPWSCGVSRSSARIASTPCAGGWTSTG